MNMKRTAVAAALTLGLGLGATVANAAPITSLTLTGGDFAMAGQGGTINPAAFASMSVDGTYDGSAPAAMGTEAEYAPTSIATFAFGGFGPVATYTQQTDSASNGPFPGVTGDLSGNNLTLDLRSWTAWWNGTDFNQGAAGVTATTDAGGNFTASWTAPVVGGPFNGQTGSWTITGTAGPVGSTPEVPIPAAVWLFGSGLLGLVGVARRKKAV